ncbi:PQQ-binding-like beta-propeller repeat protein [Actinoplanes sp. NPDC024001]|uniref:outer membrane protein assembly factor BamB family protein n=1 Tax=Actinoplanes sp. NPDC024001 TaxID=3154598 RepID=UPI0033E45467
MTVIELGDVSSDGPAPPDHRAGSGFSPGTWRRRAAGGVALLCALLLGASARPGTPMVHDVWETRLAADYALTMRQDGLYVHQRHRDRGELVAYETATGRVRWTRPFDGTPTYMGEGEEAGILLVPGNEKMTEIVLEDGNPGLQLYGGSTTAIDSATGDRLWGLSGEVLDVRRDAVLLGDRTSGGDLSAIRLVRARTGTTVWQRAVAGTHQVVVHGDVIVIADADGDTTVLRHATGAVRDRHRLAWTPTRPSDGVETYLSKVNGLLLVNRNDPARAEIAAYRFDTLEQLWRTERSPYAYAQDCGLALCIAESAGVSAVEPLSGRQLWQIRDHSSVAAVTENRVLVSIEGPDQEQHLLVEPTTGRRIGAGGAGWTMSTADSDEGLLLIRRVGEGTLSSVSHLDLESGRLVRIGAIDGADAPQCYSAGRYLACDRAGRLVVTAFG